MEYKMMVEYFNNSLPILPLEIWEEIKKITLIACPDCKVLFDRNKMRFDRCIDCHTIYNDILDKTCEGCGLIHEKSPVLAGCIRCGHLWSNKYEIEYYEPFHHKNNNNCKI
jgi:hypothetical protein